MKLTKFYKDACLHIDQDFPDNAKAIHLLMEGGSQGDSQCYYRAAELIAMNADDPKVSVDPLYSNFTKTNVYLFLEKAAQMGHGQACFDLSQLLKVNGSFFNVNALENVDLEKADYWRQRAIELNDPRSLMSEGYRLLQSGKPTEAKQYFKRAKKVKRSECSYEDDQSFFEATASAQHEIDDIDYNIKKEKEDKKFFAQNSKLAEKGNAAACYNLGRRYLNTEKNLDLAKLWLEKAANLGLRQATELLTKMQMD